MAHNERRPDRSRLDQALLDRGMAPSRAKAQALIIAGRVFSGEVRLDKPGMRVDSEMPLVVEPGARFVGRGGHKLSGALETFMIDITGLDIMDVGASTGGFTQVLIEGGASRVIALDVGRGQLDWSLRNDPRVHPLEGVNARYLDPSTLPFRPQMAVIDVSFISLTMILIPVAATLDPPGRMLALVKPQFEVGRGKVGKGGIVRDPAMHSEVLENMIAFAVENGWGVEGVSASPIKGARGNVEFFISVLPGTSGISGDSVGEAIANALEDAYS